MTGRNLSSNSFVTSPELPFHGQLPKISDGFLICFKGQSWPNAKKIVIQLLQSPMDVILSVEIIFNGDEVAIARYCSLRDKPKRREISFFDFLPKRDKIFEVILLATSSTFKCAINGHHAFNFPTYCHLDQIKSYKVSGHCDVARISFQTPKFICTPSGGNSSDKLPQVVPPPPTPGLVELPAMFPRANGNPTSPPPIGFLSSYSPPSSVRLRSPGDFDSGHPGLGNLVSISFPSGIPSNRIINLYASTLPNSQWFKISFKTSEKSSDCAFIVYVNFGKGEVIRNSCHGNVMDKRETSIPYFPFVPGESFFVMFLCLPDRFRMAVNQCHFVEFLHRNLSLVDIHHVQVEGDVFVSHFFDAGH